MAHVRVLPEDDHNRRLVSQVHPPDWINPQPARRYNLVVIGAGTAGLVTAAGAAGLGAKVALVERHLLGGDCLNVGCVPSKALIRSARAAHDVRTAAGFGIRVSGGVAVDFPAVMERLRQLRADISPHDAAARFRDLGVDVFLGAGTFSGAGTVEVAGHTLRFKRAVIATGARAVLPRIPGLAEASPLTNENVFSLTELPPRLAVIGAGPIGCEMAQAFQRLGSRVTLLNDVAQILPREDPDAAAILQKQMASDGVELALGARVREVRMDGDERIVVHDIGGEARELRVDRILVGVGRAPNVSDLGLEKVGVQYDPRKGVAVDDQLHTSNPRIYAAGDVCSAFKFTHTADAQARIVIQNALFHGRAKTSALAVPWCTYTDPEIAHVGLYEAQAREQGLDIATFTQSLADVDRAILEGETEGFIKVHTDAKSSRIAGATIVARHAGEMISELTVGIVAGLGLGTYSKTIHPYPTQAEAIRRTGDAFMRTKLTPFVQSLFRRWLAWTR